MAFTGLFGRSTRKTAATAAYVAAVEQARDPVFYTRFGVPDTLDGRFEMIALHLFLILYRLRDEPGCTRFGQALFDTAFADMDRSLREIGIGDLSVGRQVQHMARSFYGRTAAYQAGLTGTGDLDEALRRNLFGTVAAPRSEDVAAMALYLHRQAAALATQSAAQLGAGQVRFLPADPASDAVAEAARAS